MAWYLILFFHGFSKSSNIFSPEFINSELRIKNTQKYLNPQKKKKLLSLILKKFQIY